MIKQLYYRLLNYSFVRFSIVGFLGFVVNYVALTVMFRGVKLNILPAQILSAELALIVTFLGNNYWAFRDHHHISVRVKIIKYHLSSGAGLIINTAIVSLLVTYAHFFYGLALVLGSITALLWNFTINSTFIFKKSTTAQNHPQL